MTTRRIGLPVLASALAAALAPTALAAPDPGKAAPAALSDLCVPAKLSKPFAPWKDRHNYTPVPNGGLESGTSGWLLFGGAAPGPGARPKGAGSHVLTLGAGASAVTPPVCVGLHYPFFRFFAKHNGTSRSRLRVEVLYVAADGSVRVHEASRLRQPRGAWAPSRRFPLPKGLVAHTKGSLSPVLFRFTPVGAKATWEIDDVFVDPYRRG